MISTQARFLPKTGVIFVLAPRARGVEKKTTNKSTRAAPGTRPHVPTPLPAPSPPRSETPGPHAAGATVSVDGSFSALIKAMPLAATEGGFITSNSEVWGNVTALCEVKSGHCKSMR
jgi:hypothetical protein